MAEIGTVYDVMYCWDWCEGASTPGQKCYGHPVPRHFGEQT